MTTGRLALIVTAGTTGLLAGCVDRRYLVETNVPGAQVYVDGKPIGPSPADGWYVYPGKYEFKAVAPGFEPLIRTVKFKPHWFDYPGLDLVAEVFYPFQIEDVRHVQLTLEPARVPRSDELVRNAEDLRGRGATLPPPRVPNDEPASNTGRPAQPISPGPAPLSPTPPPPNLGSPTPIYPGTGRGAPGIPGPGAAADPGSIFPAPSSGGAPPVEGLVPEPGTGPAR